MRRAFWGLLAISFLWIFFGISRNASAQTVGSNVWDSNVTLEQSKTVTYVEVQNRYDCRYAQSSSISLRSPFTYIFGTIPLMLNPIITPLGNKCIIDNQNGNFTSEYLQGGTDTYQTSYYFGDDTNKMYDLSPILSGTSWIDPAPNSDTVLFLVKSSASDKTYVVQTYNDIGSAKPGIRNNKLGWEFAYQQPEIWKDKDNVNFKIDEYAFSPNGQFMAIHYKSTIAKVNLKNMEMTPVAYETTLIGNELAISNDGRYLSKLNSNRLFVIDTEDCEVSYDSGAWDTISGQLTYPGCNQSQDIIPVLVSGGQISSGKFYKRPYFSADSKKLNIAVGTRRTDVNTGSSTSPIAFNWQEAILTANNHVSNVQGYLAMGDSFSSGEGDLQGGTWYEPGTDEQGNKDTFEGRNLCHLSRRSYPYLIAKELGYLSGDASEPITPPDSDLFHSVACSGAVIHNIVGTPRGPFLGQGSADTFTNRDNQYSNTYLADLGRWQPGRIKQLDTLDSFVFGGYSSLEPKPEVITLAIGGNDAGFGDTIKACTLDFAKTCKYAVAESKDAGDIATRIMQQKPRLVETYKAAKSASPESRIYVHGYPIFIQGYNGNCNLNVPLNSQETALVEEGVKYMNQIVKAAAQEAGVFYIDVEDILNGINLCSGAGHGIMAMNGVTEGNDIDFRLCVFRTGCLGSESFHPNPIAHKKYADRISQATNNLLEAMPDSQIAAMPIPDVFFGESARNQAIILNNGGKYTTIIPTPSPFVNIGDDGLHILQDSLLPGSTLRVELQSTPVAVAEFIVPSSGIVNLPIELPPGAEPGSHELHIFGTDNFGNAFDYYEPIIIAVSETDFDGDGVLDDVDSCITIINSFVDADDDSIDDVCDSEIIIIPPPLEIPPDVIIPEVLDHEKGDPNPETVAGDEEKAPPQVLGASTTNGGTVQQQVLGVATTLVKTGKETGVNLIVGTVIVLSVWIVFRVRTRD